MKNNDISKRRYRYKYRIVVGRADGRTNGQCADPGIVSSSPDLTDRKSSDNLELGILQFYDGGPMVYFKEIYCFLSRLWIRACTHFLEFKVISPF